MRGIMLCYGGSILLEIPGDHCQMDRKFSLDCAYYGGGTEWFPCHYGLTRALRSLFSDSRLRLQRFQEDRPPAPERRLSHCDEDGQSEPV